MYMHLGENTVVKLDEVIGIFDLDNTTVSKSTRDFLNLSEKRKEVINVSYELPKSFIVCSNKRKNKRVYISQISSTTLNKRSGFIDTL